MFKIDVCVEVVLVVVGQFVCVEVVLVVVSVCVSVCVEIDSCVSVSVCVEATMVAVAVGISCGVAVAVEDTHRAWCEGRPKEFSTAPTAPRSLPNCNSSAASPAPSRIAAKV